MLALALALAMHPQEEEPQDAPFGVEDVRATGKVVGLELTQPELELMLDGVIDNLRSFERMRARPLANGVPMALVFDPLAALGRTPEADARAPRTWPVAEGGHRPEHLEDLAYASIPALAGLIRSRAVSCEELSTM